MFDYCLYLNTIALVCSVEREWVVTYAPLNLTPSQGFVLRVVLRQPGVPSRELAEVPGTARPAATRLANGLTVKGLVERQPSAEDDREWNLFPTEAVYKLETVLQATSSKVAWRLCEYIGAGASNSTVQAIHNVRSTLNT